MNEKTITLWSVDITSMAKTIALDEYLHWLSASELERKSRFYFTKHQNTFYYQRLFQRSVLANYLNCSPEDIVFETGRYGKPRLSTKHNSTIEFNLSHSQEYCVLAISDGIKVGVDIEYKDKPREFLGIAERFFSRKEFNELLELPAILQEQAFFHLWACNEAFIKAIGMGLHYSLEKFSMRADPRLPAKITIPAPKQDIKEEWLIQAFELDKAYQGALVFQDAVAQYTFLYNKFEKISL